MRKISQRDGRSLFQKALYFKNKKILLRLYDKSYIINEGLAFIRKEYRSRNIAELLIMIFIRGMEGAFGYEGKTNKIKYEMKPEAMTDVFKCHRCRSRSSYYEVQTGSADEPMTQFINCRCGNH